MRNLLIAIELLVASVAAWWMQNPFEPGSAQQLLMGAQLTDARRIREAFAAGASIEARDGVGMTALMWAAANGDEALVQRLLSAGASVSVRCHNNQTALGYAAAQGDVAVVRMLLAAGSPVNERGFCNGTALHAAAAMSTLEVARVLLAHGAHVNARDSAGRTPLIIAASRDESGAGMIQLLIENGADLDVMDDQRNRALDAHNKIVSFIWGIADDVLRDLFVRGKYRDVILVRLFDEVIRAAGSKTALYMTWARKHMPEAQEAITSAYESIGHEIKGTVVPVGLAWERFLAKHDSPVLPDRDESHPTLAGSYLAACVFLPAVFGSCSVGAVSVDGITPTDADRLQRVADPVIK